MSDQPPVKRRIGEWKLLDMMVGTLALLIGGGGWWWYVSDSDLRDFRTHAHAAGVALTWEEAGHVVAPAERLAIWNELGALIDGKTLTSRQESGKFPLRKPFAADLDDLRAHHATFAAARLARLLDLVDRLGNGPLVLRDQHAVSTLQPEIAHYRALTRLLLERVLLADPQDVPRECRRLLGLCATIDSSTFLSDLVRTSVIEVISTGIVERLDVLRERDPGIAELFTGLDALGASSLLQAASGELILAHALCSDPQQIPPTDDWLTTRLTVRVGRRELLDRELDFLLFLRGTPAAQATLLRTKTFSALPSSNWNPRYLLSRQTLPMFEYIVVASLRSRLRARLLAAELRGLPWPRDDFDPTGATLRRWERDGRLVGAYSVGQDGDDDGGQEKLDLYFPLYGPRDAPAPAAP